MDVLVYWAKLTCSRISSLPIFTAIITHAQPLSDRISNRKSLPKPGCRWPPRLLE